MTRDSQTQHRDWLDWGSGADICTFINGNLNMAWILGYIIKLVSHFWGVIQRGDDGTENAYACWNDWVKCIPSASYFPTAQLTDWHIHAVNSWKILKIKRRVFSDKLCFAFLLKHLGHTLLIANSKMKTVAPQSQVSSAFLRDCF